jgi:hypothetical protein
MMSKTTSHEMFELWQKMVNPGGYPLQSLMFPVLDAKEIDRKVGELQTVEQWLRANLNMLQMSIKALEYQRALLKGGEKFQEKLREGRDARGTPAPDAGAEPSAPGAPPNPAMWAWEMMAKASQDAMAAAQAPAAPRAARAPAKRRTRAK